MRKRQTSHAFTLVTLFLLLSLQTFASGPLALRDTGQPFKWPNGGTNIPFNPDQGGLGPMTNAQAVAQTTSAFQTWGDLPTASTTYVNAGSLSVDVNITNFDPFLNPTAPDGLSAIVYDEHGEIFNFLFGEDSGVLGFAGPEWVNPTTGDIIEGMGFMNGGALEGPNAFPVDEFLSVEVHEFGHYQNLAHTVVNGQVAGFGDNSGPTPNDTFPPPSGGFAGHIETMYPFLFVGGGQATPHQDDIGMLSTLYPDPSFTSSSSTVTGMILAPNGTTALTGVNVIARNVDNPYDDAVSSISSDLAFDLTPGAPLVGVYTLRGLTPGAHYAIYTDEVLAGGFSTPPLFPLPGPEEFYNGANESNNGATDDPAVFTAVSAPAGATQNGINIIFNKLQPGPIPLGDDSSVELFPPFPIELCGQRFDSLFVNSNGNITFGQSDDFGFLESTPEFLHGPPRVAGLWDDLDPSSGGVVSFSETATTFTVKFSNVPEFTLSGPLDSNSFEITFFKKVLGPIGNSFRLKYGKLDATDGLSGYSCGGRVTSGFENEVDLERFRLAPLAALVETAIFEQFTTDNDLDNKTISFLGTTEPRDPFEPNNSIARARRVNLPFDSSSRLTPTEIKPLGNDVDFYRFRAKAGEILVAETVPGLTDMDTLIGLFDKDGNLLTANDDGGGGLLSRIAVTVPADGDYIIGVTTFPDTGFTGAGEDFGRYVLTINTYAGTLLTTGDDDAAEVPFTTFKFPFNGTNWSSVFVNGNGSLTFGAPDPDFSESVPEFLAGMPRISPLWDDLTPDLGPSTRLGLVLAEEKNKTLTIKFVSVPEFFADTPNYFTVTLDKQGEVNFDYGATARSDALVGLTPGGGAADPGPTDLSKENHLSAVGTTYEQFPSNVGVDLSFSSLRFKKH